MVLLAHMSQAASAAIRAYVDVAKAFGQRVSIPKTKFMVVGGRVSEEEKLPLALDDGLIEWVSEFPYLRSLIANNGRMDAEVEKRITNASKAFGALR